MNKVERIACNLNCVLVTFACLDLINSEVASSQYGPPLQNTKGVLFIGSLLKLLFLFVTSKARNIFLRGDFIIS